MTQLIPCPGCNRHVRQGESSCPFCAAELSLGHVPPHELPRTRLGRAATFAFGATLVGATTLLACGGQSEDGKKGGGGGAAGAGGSSAGSPSNGGTFVVGPVYGAPSAGTTSDDGNNGSAGQASGGTGVAGTGGTVPPYGAPPSGGSPGVPIYGAAPAD